jgi:hypothetical protein
MARSLAVKIPTAVLIADIEASIAKIEAEVAEYPAKRQKYEADSKQYEADCVAHAINLLTNKSDLIGDTYESLIRVSFGGGYRGGNITVAFDTDALGFPVRPECPDNPNEKSSYGREWTTKLDLLKKNLKVLKMTNQEEVNASTYNTVMELL